MTNFERCIACEGEQFKKIRLTSGHNAYECSSCGLIRAAETAPEKNLYEDGYDDKKEGFTWHHFLSTQKKIKEGCAINLSWHEQKLLKKYGKVNNRKLLEVGCSTGRFLHAARQRGWDVHGIDISSKAVELAGEIIGHEKVHCGTLDDNTFDDSSFDLVTSYEVIEHVDDPFTFMRQINKVLKSGGTAAVSTPDWANRFIRRHPRVNYWPPYHIWFFSSKNIKMLFEKTGFEVKEIWRRKFAWSETCWPKWKRLLLLPYLLFRGIILNEGNGRIVIIATKIN